MNLPKIYQAKQYESDVYKLWEDSKAFAPREHGHGAFSIVLPPPNATGKLHVGHAAMLAIEDTIVRHQRMLGKSVLWVPGTDHSGIATNAIIEKTLAKDGKTKHDVGRKKFLDMTHSYVEESKDNIRQQIRAMGASVSWDHERYTMEPAMNRIVTEVFTKMFNDEILYRGHRIVNWDPVMQTTVADDEVEHVEETTTLYTLKYGPFEIATARPETKFGDKYVVMHPEDKRYAKYKHGDTFEADWINGKVTATVIKDDVIDPKFGTGVMTITPWHDATDFGIAERHDLDKQQIIGFDGKLLKVAGDFEGEDIKDARKKIVAKMKKKGLIVAEDSKYIHNVSVNYRNKGVIEPQIKEQWFVDVNKPALKWKGKKRSLKEVMQLVIRENDIDILPPHFEKTYFAWVDNLRDWCVSRQIWWGHRIPAYYRDGENGREVHVGESAPDGDGWQQDPDTLDTWFSSALWTWSTMIEPDIATNPKNDLKKMLSKSKLFNKYHPTTLMETGYDILFFWVARMVLMTTYITNDIPFKSVYLHGLVRTKDGKKMSKSSPETMIDPLDMIEKYGTDALRLSLIVGQAPGNDMRIYEEKIASYRNFCNKLWNIARYVEDKIGDDYTPKAPKPVHTADHWILSRLDQTVTEVGTLLENYQIGQAYEKVYHFIWSEFADWYVEASKVQFNPDVLAHVLEVILQITHPFAPFITETIWDTLKWEDSLLINRDWPKTKAGDRKQMEEFQEIMAIVTEVRHLRSQLNMNNNKLYFKESDFLEKNSDIITRLTRLKGCQKVSSGKGLHLTKTKEECWIDVEEQKAHDYLMKLIKKRLDSKKSIQTISGRLDSKGYTKKAPKEIVQQSREQLAREEELLARLENEIEVFENALRKT